MLTGGCPTDVCRIGRPEHTVESGKCNWLLLMYHKHLKKIILIYRNNIQNLIQRQDGSNDSSWYRISDFPHTGHHWNRHHLLSGKEMKTYSSLMSTWCHCKLKNKLSIVNILLDLLITRESEIYYFQYLLMCHVISFIAKYAVKFY